MFWLALSDLGANASVLVFHRNYGWLPHRCEAQAALQQFFSMASVFWSAVLACTLYAAVVLRDARGNSKLVAFVDAPVLVHAAVWGSAAATAAVPWCTHSYGPAGTYAAPSS